MIVTVDGIKHSLATAYFKREGRGRDFAASVADDELLRTVAHLVDDPTRLVRATFLTYTTTTADGLEERTSRALRSIAVIGDLGHQETLQIGS